VSILYGNDLGLTDCLEKKFSAGFDFTVTIKLILIIANSYCMLLLATAVYSIITDMA